MGNRAIIQTRESYENNGIGIYLHWNGGYDSVNAFLTYCKLKEYRSPETDNYGWARLCQVIGNFFGGGLSIGISVCSKDSGEWCDNGTYIIEDWEIVDRKYHNGSEQNEYNLIDMLISIDKCQPEKEQLGEDFFRAKEVNVKELNIGDIVYLRRYGENYQPQEIVGFGDDVMVNGNNVKGIPYVEGLYDGGPDNINNYIRQDVARVRNI